jgi:hypothetical protein
MDRQIDLPGCSYASKSCDRVYGHVINKGIDRVMGILNDRDLPKRYESAAFPRKPTVPPGIRKYMTRRVRGNELCDCLEYSNK